MPVDVVHTALKKALDMNESQSRQLRVTKFAKEMYLARLSTEDLKNFGGN